VLGVQRRLLDVRVRREKDAALAMTVLEKIGAAIMILAIAFWTPGKRFRPSIAHRLDLGCGVFFIAFGVGALLWVISRLWEKQHEHRRFGIYQGATRERGDARIHTGRTVERDLIELPGPPCPATVRFFHHDFGDRRRPYTEFSAATEGVAGALRVSSPEWSAALNPFYGGRDLTIGEAEFDRRFTIQSNPPAFAPEYLDGPTRDLIQSLERLGEGPFMLQVRPGQLVVRAAGRLQDGPILGLFISRCYDLVRRLNAVALPSGIELGATFVPADAKCPVCGTKIDPAPRVLCRKCATPHHAECWAYNDGCSTFACGERRSRRA
jgi:Prokaryotic RING finger family 1